MTWSLASLGAFPDLVVSRYALRSMISHPASRFARYHDGSQGFMKQLRLAGSFMAMSLAPLGGYHGGSLGFMKQLRLAGSFMAIPLASLGDYHHGSEGSMKQLRIAVSFMVISLALLLRLSRFSHKQLVQICLDCSHDALWYDSSSTKSTTSDICLYRHLNHC